MTTHPPLTYDEHKAAEAAFHGLPLDSEMVSSCSGDISGDSDGDQRSRHCRRHGDISPGYPIRAERAMSVRGDLMKQPVKSKRRKIGSARFEVQMDVQFLGLTPDGDRN